MPSLPNKTDTHISWLLKIILGLCFVVPLFVFDSFLFPYTFSKGFIFRILVETALPFYLFSALKNPSLRPKKTALNFAVLFFFLIWIFSAILGVDFNLSFWGNMERMIGIWGMAHFVLFFFMLQGVFRTGKDWESLLKISVGAGSLISFLAIVQKFAALGDSIPQADRVSSTIGNSAFLASYLIFNLFFAVYLSGKNFRAKNKASAWIFLSASFLNLTAIFLTGTRGAFLGLIAGVFSGILAAAFLLQKKQRTWALSVLGIMLVLGAVFFSLRGTGFFRTNGTLGRLSNISLNEETAQSRILVWKQSWRAWQERPVLGWGPENFEAASNRYFDPKLNSYEAWYDRAHNFIFDYGVSSGWLGLAGYFSMAVLAFFYLWRESLKNPFFSIVFGSLLAAYLVQNLLVFDTLTTFLVLFLTLAFINFTVAESDVSRKVLSRPKLSSLWLVFGILIAIISIYSFNIKPIMANHLAARAMDLYPTDAAGANDLLKKSLAQKTFASPEIAYQATMDYLAKIGDYSQLAANRNFYEISSAEISEIIKSSPKQARYYVAIAWLNLYFSEEKDKIDSVLNLAGKIKELAPAKKDSFMISIAAHSLSGRKEEAWRVVEEVKKIDWATGESLEEYWRDLNE